MSAKQYQLLDEELALVRGFSSEKPSEDPDNEANKESHVKGLWNYFLNHMLINKEYQNVVPEYQTKSRQFVDFLVKGLNYKGMFEPMCCIEVKSKGGDSWSMLVAQGRRYAVEICNT